MRAEKQARRPRTWGFSRDQDTAKGAERRERVDTAGDTPDAQKFKGRAVAVGDDKRFDGEQGGVFIEVAGGDRHAREAVQILRKAALEPEWYMLRGSRAVVVRMRVVSKVFLSEAGVCVGEYYRRSAISAMRDECSNSSIRAIRCWGGGEVA